MEDNSPNQPVSPSDTPVQPQPITNQVSHQRGFFPIILGVLVLLLVVGGGAYYLGTQQNKAQTGSETILQHSPTVENTQPTQIPTTMQGQVVPANWKTYSNSELGFSLKYPEDQYTLKVQKLSGQGENYGKTFISLEPNDTFNNQKPLAVTYAVSVATVPNSNNYSLSNPRQLFGNGPLISYIPEMLGDTPVNETTLGGIKAYRVNGCCGGQAGIEADIQTVKGGQVYQIVVAPRQVSGNSQTNKDIFEKIVSSFKFSK